MLERMLCLILIVFIFSCSDPGENEDNETVTDVGYLNIVISNLFVQGELSEYVAILLDKISEAVVTIEDANSNVIYDNERITFFVLDDNYVSVDILLDAGTYRLTSFYFIDGSGSVTYISPMQGSAKSSLVNNSLPVEFSVVKNETATVYLQVLRTEYVVPESFGYSTYRYGTAGVPQLTITSPENKYYEEDPVINYTVSDGLSVEILLNGISLSISNGSTLTQSITGFNILTVKATNSAGVTETKEVGYFVNKNLAILDSDNFNRADNNDVGNGWGEENSLYNGEIRGNMKIEDNKLICTAKASLENYSKIQKWDGCGETFYYDNPCLLQIFDVVSLPDRSSGGMAINNALAALGEDLANLANWETLYAALNKRPDGLFRLSFIHYSDEYGLRFSVTTSFISIDLSTPFKFLFFRSYDDFCSCLIDSNNNILSFINMTGYLKTKYHLFRYVAFWQSDGTDNADTRAEVDNYICYF